MQRVVLWALLGLAQMWAEEIPEKANANTDSTAKEAEIAERQRRLDIAFKSFESMKADTAGLGNQGYQIGRMLAPVLMDDPRFVGEVLNIWLPVADADKSGKEMANFSYGLVSASGATDVRAAMEILLLFDSLWTEFPPPKSPGAGDALGTLWRALGNKGLENSGLWEKSTTLSPKMQAWFWLKSQQLNGANFAKDPELAERLRDAAKGSEITRAAFDWQLQSAIMNRGEGVKADVRTFLAFPKALKDAGIPPEELASLVCDNYTWIGFLENPELLLAETPVVLDGLQMLPGDLADKIIQVVAACRYLWFKPANENDVDTSGAAGFGAAEPLLEWVLTRVPESSLSSLSGSQLSPGILASNDDSLLNLWIKALGKGGAGNVPLILGLLEKNRVAEAVALDPAPGQGLFSPGDFTALMEKFVAKLRSHSSARAFHLAVRISMLDDAPSPEAPVENRSERQKRLTAEFERMRGSLSVEEQADFYQMLGVFREAGLGPVPALGEYAGEAAAREFRAMLSTGKKSATAGLYVSLACSRAISGDLNGINDITSAIDSAPIGFICDQAIENHVLRPVVGCFVTHANNTDVRLPEASVQAMLGFAKALAGRQTPQLSRAASRLVYLAATDEASLAAGLKRCDLEKVKPAVAGAMNAVTEMRSDMLSKEIRVALLHPSFSKILLASLSEVWASDDGSPLVPLLGDPKLRAGIPPELFVRWNLRVRSATPEGLKSMKLYVTERRREFDMQQRSATENLMYRLENRHERSDRDYYNYILRESPFNDSRQGP